MPCVELPKTRKDRRPKRCYGSSGSATVARGLHDEGGYLSPAMATESARTAACPTSPADSLFRLRCTVVGGMSSTEEVLTYGGRPTEFRHPPPVSIVIAPVADGDGDAASFSSLSAL